MNFFPKPVSILYAVFASIIFAGCNKNDNSASGDFPENNYVAQTFSKGILHSTPVQKKIDVSGGNITSVDGKLTLTIPAGALSTATDISIQPVTNTVPLGKGNSYRISPANLSLSKPVSINLTYENDAVEGADEESLDIVTQDESGKWYVMNRTSLNKNSKTLSVDTKHFGDFSTTAYYYLVPQKVSVGANETSSLTVERITVPEDEPSFEETPIGAPEQFSQSAGFESWEATGAGKLESSQKTTAIYTAPAVVNENSLAEIKVTLKNVRRPLRSGTRKLSLRRNIYVTKADFMAGTYDGQPFNCIGVSVLVAGGVTTVQGVTAEGKSVLILFNGTDLGAYEYGRPSSAGKAEIRCNIVQKVYETVYTECGPPSVTKFASGALSIKRFENAGAVIAGDFSATLYNDDGCSITTKRITGSFSTRK